MKTVITRKDEKKVLEQWRGAKAQIWIFDVSLRRMAIRVYRPNEQELIYVTAVGCERITGPFCWDSANIAIEVEPPDAEHPDICRIIDRNVAFELTCSDARVVKGPSTDFDKTFDNFLTES